MVHTINAYPSVNMLVILTHKYKDSLTLRYPPNINTWLVSQFLIPRASSSLIPLWMSIIRTMHSLIYHSNIGTYTLSFISWCEHVHDNNWNILSNNSRTLKCPPNMNTWLVSQCRYPQVDSMIPLWMLITHTVHSPTYHNNTSTIYHHMYLGCQNVFQRIPQLYKDTHQTSKFD